MNNEIEEVIFRRFPPEKQDQIRQLISFTTLMGLNGKDLISIGGTIERFSSAGKRKRNVALAKDLYNTYNVQPIKISQRGYRYTREAFTTINLSIEPKKTYTLIYEYSSSVRVSRTDDNKNIRKFQISEYETGASRNHFIYKMLLALHNKEILLQ
jgi:hypothetical protein